MENKLNKKRNELEKAEKELEALRQKANRKPAEVPKQTEQSKKTETKTQDVAEELADLGERLKYLKRMKRTQKIEKTLDEVIHKIIWLRQKEIEGYEEQEGKIGLEAELTAMREKKREATEQQKAAIEELRKLRQKKGKERREKPAPAPKREEALQTLKKTIEKIQERMRRREELIERLRQELAELEIEKQKQEKVPEIKTFSLDFIRKTVEQFLKSRSEIKKIKRLIIEGMGDKLKLAAQITASKFFITSEITLEDVFLGNQGNTIGLIPGFKISATVGEDKIKSLMEDNIGSIGTELKKYIEKQEGKKVKKIEIADGQLKVEFV